MRYYESASYMHTANNNLMLIRIHISMDNNATTQRIKTPKKFFLSIC